MAINGTPPSSTFHATITGQEEYLFVKNELVFLVLAFVIEKLTIKTTNVVHTNAD